MSRIFDCITFFDENLQADLRFNILFDCVEKFIVCESIYDHMGNYKGVKFNIDAFQKFKSKIIHLVIKDKFPDISNPWVTQAYQREYIFNGLKEADNNDYIMFSDPDEIPRPEILKNLSLKKKYGIFLQKMFCYKLNIYNQFESPWEGTRVSLKKNLKSIDFLRQKVLRKNLRYPFWRLDKERNIQLFNDAGWHFNYLKKPQQISLKLKTFAHTEFNKEEFTDIKKIEDNINNLRDLFGRNHIYSKVDIDSSFPEYIVKNKNTYKDWII